MVESLRCVVVVGCLVQCSVVARLSVSVVVGCWVAAARLSVSVVVGCWVANWMVVQLAA